MRAHALAAALAALPMIAEAAYPATAAHPVTDNYHGVSVTDPYRWMEDMKSPEFQSWLHSEADYSASILKSLPGREALRQRLGVLADSGEATGGFEQAGGRIFFIRRAPGENARKLWVREGLAGTERMLLDPDALPGEGGHHAIDWISPSPDGSRIALGISLGGSENSVLRIIDATSGKLLGDAIDRTGLNEEGLAWQADGKGFFYNRHPASERYNKSAIYLHRIGEPAGRDVAVFGWEVSPENSFELADLPHPATAQGSRWVMMEVLHGDAVDRSYWIAPADKLSGAATPWRRVISPADQVTHAVLAGDAIYAVSQKKASNRELIRLDLAPGGETRTVVPASAAVLQFPVADKDAIYVKALDAGVSRLIRVPLKAGKPSEVKLPFEGTLRAIAPGKHGLLVQLEGWVHAPEVFALKNGKALPTDLQKPLKLDTSPFEARRVMVKSHDGVEVPLSLIVPKKLALDGRRPTILTGYGAYGISMEPRFNPSRLAWLERGGVQAVCHVRGGGELGEAWHRGGHIATKQNTVSDFIACAEWLIANKYTSSATLAGTGGSAGGITIGGTITQRPDLLAAAQSSVGLSDMLRMELTPNGAPNVAEFGTVTNPEHFKAMFALSPYHRVREGVRYPAVIVTTGANDPRVEAWIPSKFAARLQTANPDGKPVLLRVDFDAGHGMGSTVGQAIEETADVWSFFLWQLGDAAFQPR
jgi:prolyl oligopeptidase